MSEHVALFAAGLLVLAAGAGCLVTGAARLDRATGRSAFAVGIVAVGFGPCVAGLAFDLTCVLRPAPPREAELMVATALGTVVGSNIASVLLVLGAAALVRPVASSARLFSTAIPLTFVATILFWFLAADTTISRIDAGVLLAAFVGVLVLVVRDARRESDAGKAEFAAWVPEQTSLWVAGLLALAGLCAIVVGAWLAAGELLGARTALRLRVQVMSITVVAFGTTLPALVAALVAARRGRSDLVLGLAVGPALVNLLLVAGAVATVQPITITEHAILNEIPAMAVCSLLLLPALLNGKVPRWEGALLVVAYAGFIAWQVTRVAPPGR